MRAFTNAGRLTTPGRALIRRLTRSFMVLCLALLSLQSLQANTNILTSPSDISLRNALNAGGTVILNFDGTVVLNSPLAVSVDGTVLDATGHTVLISGNNVTRVFDVATNVHFFVTNLIIASGNVVGSNGIAGGAGANGTGASVGGNGSTGGAGSNAFGGGMRNQGVTTLVNCIFSNNLVSGGNGGVGGAGGNSQNSTAGNGGNGGAGGNGYGAAVYNLGTLVLTNCTLAGNSATGGTGGTGGAAGTGMLTGYPGSGGMGAVAEGACVYNLGSATIVNCTFSQNSLQAGASLPTGGPPQANGNGLPGASGGNAQGAGVFNLGTTFLLNCTFFQNGATGGAGATGGNSRSGTGVGGTGGNGGSALGADICNTSPGMVAATNCTFANGTVQGGAAGAAGTGVFAGTAGSAGASLGAHIYNTSGVFDLRNSILAYPNVGPNANGTITDLGNNISSDGTPVFTTTNSRVNLDPQLVTLDNNGGPTLTMALSPSSPAIDRIFDGSAPPFDQRNLPRPFGTRSDIGAYEYGATTTNFSISGTVIIGTTVFPGVTVKAGSSTVQTDTNGSYQFFLAGGVNYSIAAQPLGYFNPPSVSVSLSNNMTNVNFMATNSPTTIGINTNNRTQVLLVFSAVPTFTYRVQVSTNLSTNVWKDVATNLATNGMILYTDSVTNFTNRFYRTVTP